MKKNQVTVNKQITAREWFPCLDPNDFHRGAHEPKRASVPWGDTQPAARKMYRQAIENVTSHRLIHVIKKARMVSVSDLKGHQLAIHLLSLLGHKIDTYNLKSTTNIFG